jgi:glycosyltransferase involved in cell wall biosynthesis
VARSPGIRLAVVGDGPHRGALEERSRREGIAQRVCFVGALPPEKMPDVYASADAFVFPSLTETQGLVLAEAMAAGLPVVAADSDVSRDVLDPGGRVAAADAASMAAALEAAFARGRDQSAVHLAYSRFSMEVQSQQILALYRGLLAARAA